MQSKLRGAADWPATYHGAAGNAIRGTTAFTSYPVSGAPARWANKAFNFSSVRWVRAGYNVTDDTAR
jgi:hypothetical protein